MTRATDRHQYFDDPAVSRLMAMLTSLAGEVFVLRALHERLAVALQRGGILDADSLLQAGQDPALHAWMAREKDEFARLLLTAIRDPDIAQKRHEELFGNQSAAAG